MTILTDFDKYESLTPTNWSNSNDKVHFFILKHNNLYSLEIEAKQYQLKQLEQQSTSYLRLMMI